MQNCTRSIIIIVAIACFSWTNGLSQEENVEDTTSSEGLMAKFNRQIEPALDINMAYAALRTSRIGKIGPAYQVVNPGQKRLSDTLMYLRKAIQCEVFLRGVINFDHVWPRKLNIHEYRPLRADLEEVYGDLYSNELYIDFSFSPLWDTVNLKPREAEEKGKVEWKLHFSTTTNNPKLDTATINQQLRNYAAGKQFRSFKTTGEVSSPDQIVREAIYKMAGSLLVGADTVLNDASIDRAIFTDASDSKFGFDAWDENNNSIKGQYEAVQLNGKEYMIPYKSVAVNKTDKIYTQAIPRVKNGAITDSLQFTLGSLKATVQSKNGLKSYQLQLPSKTMEGSERLNATFALNDKTYDAGYVNVIGYPEKSFEVVLVPVENKTGKGSTSASRMQIKTALDTIYAQAAVSWTVSEDDPIKVADINLQNFNAGDNELLSMYTDDMQQLVKTYQSERKNYDKNKYYIFLIPNSNKAGLFARMPLTSNFGFFFTKNLSDADKMAHTMAHELGHGAFHLYHTFSDKNQYTQTRGNTDNLMDYDNNLGTQLYKYQWDLVHNPESMVFSFMQDETEGETTSDKYILFEEFDLFNNNELILLTKKQLKFTYNQIDDDGEHELKSAKWQINDGEKTSSTSELIINEESLPEDNFKIHVYYNSFFNTDAHITIHVNWLHVKDELPAVINNLSENLKEYFTETSDKVKSQINDEFEWKLLSGKDNRFTSVGMSKQFKLSEELKQKTLTINSSSDAKSFRENYDELVLTDYKLDLLNQKINRDSDNIEWNTANLSGDEINKLTS
ncbi:MAG: hypothetical protein MI922_22020, partial [Bacteroidales bacterium]|nr:hypothetical protein [Bacteroidales bacterium]